MTHLGYVFGIPNITRGMLMDFEISSKTKEYYPKVDSFMQEHVLPNESKIDHEVETLGEKFNESPTMNDIRKKAKAAGLWNLFLP